MINLIEAARAWGTTRFRAVLTAALEGVDVSQWPLQHGLRFGSYPLDEPLDVVVYGANEQGDAIIVRVGFLLKSRPWLLLRGRPNAGEPTV